ncbi:hypothetical protein E2P81_ATG04195 [Venturia nashicola]|uniref:F-box domain-containing protein n=1 Tax=Venturia nashicola TaxID=86259 RepID=A0A4Z1PHT6_9PEZI|nr:hypothetical protein E6O75_ATG04296 [Venturia nashicola]TLD37383.1 hypothetical protein E2P81_ATG04195 [Venturia nashicola]
MQTETDGLDGHRMLLLLEQESSEPSKCVAKPLPFERLIAGIAFKSPARLLDLPFDILDEIFNYVPHRSLPSFALTSRACCRLARGRQFTNITLDYSPNSWSLAHSLLSEANLAQDPGTHRACLPSIGPAVRQLTIRSAKGYMQQYHKISVLEPRGISKDKLKEITERYQRYIRTIQLVLANSLPNIDTIIWADRLYINDTAYQAFLHSRAQHLILNGIEGDTRINAPACTTVWPLRTLHLAMADVSIEFHGSQTEVIWNTVIRLSAPYLEALTWVTGRDCTNNLGFAVRRTTFPALRRLHLAGLDLEHASVYESLMSTDSRIRWLGVQQTCIGHYLSQCGTLSSLESVTWFAQPAEADEDLLSYLGSNTHLKELYIRKPLPNELLDKNLLPLLGSRFGSLTSLFLVGAGEVFEESSLELVGKIRTLELLHLSAGDQEYSFQWTVTHDAIRHHLSPLTNLKKLLFSRDIRTMPSVSSPDDDDDDDDDDDASFLDSDGDTSSMNFGENPNTDLDAIIAAVALGAMLAPIHGPDAADQPQQNQEQDDDHSVDTDASDGSIDWDFTATSRRPFSVTGSGIERSSLSRLLQRMRDGKVEEEAQAYFSAFETLEMVYIGRQAFDRGYEHVTGMLWQNKRWADLEDLLPSMMRRLDV